MRNITVVGAGTMGNGIAHVFAQSGFQVNLVDISQDALDRAMKTIEKNLDLVLEKVLFIFCDGSTGGAMSHRVHETHAMELHFSARALVTEDLPATTAMMLQ